jgi:hypothetical protein
MLTLEMRVDPHHQARPPGDEPYRLSEAVLAKGREPKALRGLRRKRKNAQSTVWCRRPRARDLPTPSATLWRDDVQNHPQGHAVTPPSTASFDANTVSRSPNFSSQIACWDVLENNLQVALMTYFGKFA